MAEPSASERAYAVLRDGILTGVYQPGTMLGEASLARDLGVSRTPVRVALTRLQQEGWIEIYPKRGALVQGLSERTIVELADARFILETTGVDRASPALRQRLVERQRASIVKQRAALESQDVRAFVDLTLSFHRGFVEAAGSEVLLELYDRLADRQRFLLFAAGDRLLARFEAIIAEHELLTSHLLEGEVEAFATTLRGHIAEVGSEPPSLFHN